MSFRRIQCRALALIALVCFPKCQQAADDPQTVTVCELLASSHAYSGLRVRVTGMLQGSALYARACALDLRLNGRQWPVAIVLATDNSTVESELKSLRSNNETPYGRSHDLIVELAGTFEAINTDAGATLEKTRNAYPLAGRLQVAKVITSRQERPKAFSVCEVLADPSRYHNQVIAVQGEHRWLRGDQILYNATCGPAGGSILTPAPEDKTDTRIPPDTPLNVLRVSLEFIAKGRFEAWQPGVDGFESSRKGFGNCGCYQGRLTHMIVAYFTLTTVPPQPQ